MGQSHGKSKNVEKREQKRSKKSMKNIQKATKKSKRSKKTRKDETNAVAGKDLGIAATLSEENSSRDGSIFADEMHGFTRTSTMLEEPNVEESFEKKSESFDAAFKINSTHNDKLGENIDEDDETSSTLSAPWPFGDIRCEKLDISHVEDDILSRESLTVVTEFHPMNDMISKMDKDTPSGNEELTHVPACKDNAKEFSEMNLLEQSIIEEFDKILEEDGQCRCEETAKQEIPIHNLNVESTNNKIISQENTVDAPLKINHKFVPVEMFSSSSSKSLKTENYQVQTHARGMEYNEQTDDTDKTNKNYEVCNSLEDAHVTENCALMSTNKESNEYYKDKDNVSIQQKRDARTDKSINKDTVSLFQELSCQTPHDKDNIEISETCQHSDQTLFKAENKVTSERDINDPKIHMVHYDNENLEAVGMNGRLEKTTALQTVKTSENNSTYPVALNKQATNKKGKHLKSTKREQDKRKNKDFKQMINVEEKKVHERKQLLKKEMAKARKWFHKLLWKL